MNARNEDFDTIDPHVRAQLFAENDAKAVRALADETYEQTTQGADAWRDRMAQRHRFGRVLDIPPLKGDGIERGMMWWTVVAVVSWLAAAIAIWSLT